MVRIMKQTIFVLMTCLLGCVASAPSQGGAGGAVAGSGGSAAFPQGLGGSDDVDSCNGSEFFELVSPVDDTVVYVEVPLQCDQFWFDTGRPVPDEHDVQDQVKNDGPFHEEESQLEFEASF